MRTTVSLDVDGTTTVTQGGSRTFGVAAGQRITATVTDTYTAAPPSPSGSSSVLPTNTATNGPLPPTGPADEVRWSLLAGLALVGAGLALTSTSLAVLRRGRHSG